MGARPSSGMVAAWRGLTPIEDGDILQPICDYYLYDGTYEDNYPLGDVIEANGPIQVDYIDLGDVETSIKYRLTDIYGNHYWTESIAYS